MRRLTILVLAIAAVAACDTPQQPPPERRLEVVDVLGGGAVGGFARALEPRPFRFPEDHGPHPAFATEWWYFTGNLDGDDGRRFGYQFTLFRTALQPPGAGAERPSAWATEQVWMGHFAVTDIDAGRFHAFDRFQRQALGLAGARAQPWRVWLDDWGIEQIGERPFPLRLRAAEGTGAYGDGGERIAIDLTLDAVKPIVLQGNAGLSRKGATPGNASYYYSFTRLITSGEVHVDGTSHPVRGTSWLDREWSTSVLEDGQIGWDWFALQLDDGSDLMYYQIREANGDPAPTSAGTLVLPDGSYVALPSDDVRLQVTARWTSPIDGARYPSGWLLEVPGRGVALVIEPLLDDQELDVAFRYWEGAVTVSGNGLDGAPIAGRGYVELTGYAGDGLHP